MPASDRGREKFAWFSKENEISYGLVNSVEPPGGYEGGIAIHVVMYDVHGNPKKVGAVGAIPCFTILKREDGVMTLVAPPTAWERLLGFPTVWSHVLGDD